ncbi:MAG: archaeosine synthase subunit alpha [Halobacteriaceae archaeon]
MTEYFEVHTRDGPARRGELRLPTAVETPALVGPVDVDDHDAVASILRDAGSRWRRERSVPDTEPSELTILPHRAFPRGTDDRVKRAFEPAVPDLADPTAAVVAPETAADHGVDAYVLAGAPGHVGHARSFREAITTTRRSIPDDTALYLPGVATPGNVALLAYAGVDLVDADRAVVRGTQGRYLTPDGPLFLEDLEELPCACAACQRPREEFDRTACVTHNVAVLAAELRRVRERIRSGRLRDYLEGQVRHDQWQTAAFRRFDQEWTYLEERTPVFRRAELAATTGDALNRPEIQRFADRVTTRYVPRIDDGAALLVPCSARKPYSDSQSHRRFQDAANYRAHVVSMTSPIGVVPTELELTYPAQHYDAAVTGAWTEEEIDFVATVLERYLARADYDRVVAHVPDEGYRPAVERATDALDITPTYTVADHPTDDASLSALADALDGAPQIRVADRERATVRAVADYQFGDGAGDAVFGDLSLEGRHPKLRVLAGADADADEGTLLATLVPSYGLLALTLAGARAWVDSGVGVRRVEIDDFVPHGSVLAPGVVAADDGIRVGDEVVVEGPSAFAVGRATMHGSAMTESTRGVAVDVRHSTET